MVIYRSYTGSREVSYNDWEGTMTNIKSLIEGDFFGTDDEQFTAFIKQMPDKHWSKYDLSAVRLGWEAHKMTGANKLAHVDSRDCWCQPSVEMVNDVAIVTHNDTH